MRFRFRLLPVTMFALGLMLTVKVGGLWQGGVPVIQSVAVAESNAQQEADAADAAEDDSAAMDDADMPPVEPLIEEDFDNEATPAGLDPANMSQSELDLLQRLRERREELKAREAELDMRENTVKAAEHALEARIEDWKRLKEEVETMLAGFEQRQEDDLKTLAVYYEKMKPKDAARVFNALEMTYLVDIVQRMKDAKVAEIIGKMDTDKAKLLTMELAQRLTMSQPSGEPMAPN